MVPSGRAWVDGVKAERSSLAQPQATMQQRGLDATMAAIEDKEPQSIS